MSRLTNPPKQAAVNTTVTQPWTRTKPPVQRTTQGLMSTAQQNAQLREDAQNGSTQSMMPQGGGGGTPQASVSPQEAPPADPMQETARKNQEAWRKYQAGRYHDWFKGGLKRTQAMADANRNRANNLFNSIAKQQSKASSVCGFILHQNAKKANDGHPTWQDSLRRFGVGTANFFKNAPGAIARDIGHSIRDMPAGFAYMAHGLSGRGDRRDVTRGMGQSASGAVNLGSYLGGWGSIRGALATSGLGIGTTMFQDRMGWNDHNLQKYQVDDGQGGTMPWSAYKDRHVQNHYDHLTDQFNRLHNRNRTR